MASVFDIPKRKRTNTSSEQSIPKQNVTIPPFIWLMTINFKPFISISVDDDVPISIVEIINIIEKLILPIYSIIIRG